MSGTPGYVRWAPSEWLRVAVNMLPYLDKGDTRLVALGRAMRRCLSKDRHKDDPWVHKTSAPRNVQMNQYLDKARALSDDERAMHYVPTPAEAYALANPDAPVKPRKAPAPRKRLDEGRDYGGNVRWTTLEKAKIVRMVKWFEEHGVKTSLGRMMVEAQELVLPADRRRAVGGIMQGNHGGQNKRAYEDGANNLWLLKDIPFNPPQPPGDEPEASEQAQEATQAAQEAPNEPEVVHTPPDAPRALAAPPGSIREAMTAAVAQFGDTLRSAMDTLLMQQTALVIHQMESRMLEQASRTAAEVAGLIEGELRKSVHAMVEQELGGPVSPPSVDGKATATPIYVAPPADPANVPKGLADQPAPTPKVKQLKVDVVGMNNGREEQLIREAFNGETDLRFFNPDSSGSYAPHRGRECIMVTQRVPHSLKFKIKAAGVEPLYVKPTTGHVIHAIEELLRAQGIAQAAHSH